MDEVKDLFNGRLTQDDIVANESGDYLTNSFLKKAIAKAVAEAPILPVTKELLETAKEILASGPRAKMQTCPFCHKRRRLGEKCCSAEYRKGSETAFVTKTYVKRFQKKHHGQSREYQIRRLTLEFFADPARLAAAVTEMGITAGRKPIIPALANIPPFAEKFWAWTQKRKATRLRRQQRLSRRINART